MEGYKHRVMDSLLEKKLQAKGAVLIEGPKLISLPANPSACQLPLVSPNTTTSQPLFSKFISIWLQKSSIKSTGS